MLNFKKLHFFTEMAKKNKRKMFFSEFLNMCGFWTILWVVLLMLQEEKISKVFHFTKSLSKMIIWYAT